MINIEDRVFLISGHSIPFLMVKTASYVHGREVFSSPSLAVIIIVAIVVIAVFTVVDIDPIEHDPRIFAFT